MNFKFEFEIINFDDEDIIACSGSREFNWTLSNEFKYDPNKDSILKTAEQWLKDHGYNAN